MINQLLQYINPSWSVVLRYTYHTPGSRQENYVFSEVRRLPFEKSENCYTNSIQIKEMIESSSLALKYDSIVIAPMKSRWYELEFRHLEYAIAVQKHQGFMQAAIALELDQGFLSKQIQRIEARLGFELFDRTTRPLRLTDAGHAFLEASHQILARTQRAVELAQETQKGQLGRLDVGINTSIANSQLPAILKAFRSQFPNVKLVLHELASYDQIKQLKNHEIDIGFFHKYNLPALGAENETFEVTPILFEKLLVVLPEKHRFAKQSRVSLAKLSGEKFILPPNTLLPGLRDQINRLCIQVNCEPVIVQEAAWMTTVLSLVAGDIGVSILPANVRCLRRSGIVYCDIQEPSPVLEIVAVKQSSNKSATLKNFLEVVESWLPNAQDTRLS